MLLNIEQWEYVGEITQSAGVRVLIHGHKEMPFPDEAGVSIEPGKSTEIGVQRVSIPIDRFYFN